MATSLPIPINTAGITGTDGITPVYDGSAPWRIWGLHDIYTGGPGANRYVPKINDYAVNYETNEQFRVTHINPVTLIPTFVAVLPAGEEQSNPADVLFGGNPAVYRAYLDKSVRPYKLAVDGNVHSYHADATYAKVFLGNNISTSGTVVGFLSDSVGTFLTDQIPLELLGIHNVDNYTIRGVKVCSTNVNILNGQLVTVVFYSVSGNVLRIVPMLCEHSTFIRGANADEKYVTHISLKSPFVSLTDDHVLEYPINVLEPALNLIGVVHYSDGSRNELPVDSSKFSIFGLENYLGTVAGQTFDLVLNYKLGPTEAAYAGVSGDGKSVNASYSLVTVNRQGSYTVKLYAYPVWISEIAGYQLKWFMYNLDRDVSFDVTPYVSFQPDTTVYNPTGYGTTQQLHARINLRDVSTYFKSFIHTQIIGINLREPGTARMTNWAILFNPSQNPPFGINLHARLVSTGVSNTVVNIGSDIETFVQWTDKVYKNTIPIIDLSAETVPLTPNFFNIVDGNAKKSFPISAWNSNLSLGTVSSNVALNKTLFIEFIRREATGDIYLGMAAMPIYEG